MAKKELNGEELDRHRIMKIVGDRIAMARDVAGLTQYDLSKLAGVTRVQICNIELGRSDLPVSRLVRVARACNIKPGRLLPS